MLRLALAVLALVVPSLAAPAAPAAPAAASEPGECEAELASARSLYQGERARRLRLAAPLARAMRQVIARALTDDDRALLARFARGAAPAAEVDRALWPKLHPVLAEFNRAGCRDLGGVVRAEEVVEASTALRDGKGLHTGVVVACARRPLQGEARRFLGLRVRHGEDGPALGLLGFVQERGTPFASEAEAEWNGLAVSIPFGDRAAEEKALDAALDAFVGSEDDFTWTVPLSCRPRVTLAP
jgi:hypothetical protein